MKWMAAQQAQQALAHSAQDSVLFDRLHHVFRTGRVKPARRRQQRRDPPLIGTKYQERELHRSITFWMARSRSGKEAVSAALRGLSTMSQAPQVSRCTRKASR